MKKKRYPWFVAGLAIGAALLMAGCSKETPVPDLATNLDAARTASRHALHAEVERVAAARAGVELAELRERFACERPETCEVAFETAVARPELQSSFVAHLQLTDAGEAAVRFLTDAHSHALDPTSFQLDALEARLAVLDEWQDGQALLDRMQLSEEEATWLARVTNTLNRDVNSSRRHLATLAEGPEASALFPRHDALLDEFGTTLDAVQTAAGETNWLLTTNVIEYARLMSLDYPQTAADDLLREHQLLIEDPDDQAHRDAGGNEYAQEWLPAWRSDVLPEEIEAREAALLRVRIEQLLHDLHDNDAERSLEQLSPANPQYAALRNSFARYRRLAARDGWRAQAVSRTLERGDENEQVAYLRARLAEEGFIDVDNASEVFDEELEQALLEFQESNQLPENGETDRETREALERDPEDRLAVLALSLQRWRESRTRRDEGQYYIHANIPSYFAEIWDEGEVIYRYRVVVGKNSHDWSDTVTETTLFSDRMEKIVFNPFWHIPRSIIENEVIPEVSDDPDYIDDQRYVVEKRYGRVFIKQLPGPGNALGLVKFLFPNEFAIYMHDTPTKYLFSRVYRAHSHGCVRVHEPFELAELLIARDQGWTDRQIERYIDRALSQQEQETTFHLDTPIPVHIEYILARVDEHGHTEFFEDVYETETAALEEMRALVSQWLAVAI